MCSRSHVDGRSPGDQAERSSQARKVDSGRLVAGVPGGDGGLAAQPVGDGQQVLRHVGQPVEQGLVAADGDGATQAADGEGLDPRGDGDGAGLGTGHGERGDVDGSRVDEVVVDLVREDQDVVLQGEFDDPCQLFGGEHAARRVLRMAQQEDPGVRLGPQERLEGVEVVVPALFTGARLPLADEVPAQDLPFHGGSQVLEGVVDGVREDELLPGGREGLDRRPDPLYDVRGGADEPRVGRPAVAPTHPAAEGLDHGFVAVVVAEGAGVDEFAKAFPHGRWLAEVVLGDPRRKYVGPVLRPLGQSGPPSGHPVDMVLRGQGSGHQMSVGPGGNRVIIVESSTKC